MKTYSIFIICFVILLVCSSIYNYHFYIYEYLILPGISPFDSLTETKAVISLPELNRWPNPALVVGLPKAGTTAIQQYFKCGNSMNHASKDGNGSLKISHWRCRDGFCGKYIKKNMGDPNQSDPLYNTGDYDVYTQLDVIYTQGVCYFPQIYALNEIEASHPNSTFILNMRNVTNWVQSVKNWNTLAKRLDKCGLLEPQLDSKGLNIPMDEKLETFYWDHIQRVRDFFQNHTHSRLVELTIDSPNAGKVMENNFGIPERCWGVANKNNRVKNKKLRMRKFLLRH